MKHPTTRGDRRYARKVWRNHRRTHILLWTCPYDRPEINLGWNKGGKQYQGHGNRCMHSMSERYERRQEVKALRRRPVEHPDEK
jgi:hypothetical protein